MEMIERFRANINMSGPIARPELGPCHEWTGGRFSTGYGAFRMDGKTVYAHRLAFFLAHGRWATPCTLHKCDNRACVRGDHLFEGTKGDNNRDRDRKGRTSPTGNLASLPKARERAARPWARKLRTGLKNGAYTHPERRPRGEAHGMAKVDDATVQKIKDLRGAGYVLREISALVGLSIAQVHKICSGKSRAST